MIKNWIKFNESQLDMFSGSSYERPQLVYKSLYVLTPEDLEDYFIDFIDEKWNVNFFFAFHNEEYDYEYLVKERNVIPLIRVNIYGTNRSKGGEYLTNSLLIEKTIGTDFESLKEDYDFLNDFNTLEDLIKYTINPGYTYRSLYKQLGKMLSEIEEDSVYDDLRSMYSDYYNQQKMDDDYDAIIKSFNQIVEDVLHVSILEEYTKEDKLWYKFKFNFEWLEYEDDVEYIRKEGLNYIISNWCHQNYDKRELKPYFSDYASIDEKAFNQECREILQKL